MATETYDYPVSWERVRRVFPSRPNLSVLDIGCGDGRLTAHLVGSHDVYGVDQSGLAVREAYGKGINVIRSDIEDGLPFADGMFDVVLALDILEHVRDLGTVFKEIQRVAKPDARLIISLPNHFDARTRLAILFGHGIIRWSQQQFGYQPWNYSHIRFLTINDVRTMLQVYGWHPIMWQFNFMSQGLLPTKILPAPMRKMLVRTMPGLWSGKIVVAAARSAADQEQTIIVSETPHDF